MCPYAVLLLSTIRSYKWLLLWLSNIQTDPRFLTSAALKIHFPEVTTHLNHIWGSDGPAHPTSPAFLKPSEHKLHCKLSCVILPERQEKSLHRTCETLVGSHVHFHMHSETLPTLQVALFKKNKTNTLLASGGQFSTAKCCWLCSPPQAALAPESFRAPHHRCLSPESSGSTFTALVSSAKFDFKLPEVKEGLYSINTRSSHTFLKLLHSLLSKITILSGAESCCSALRVEKDRGCLHPSTSLLPHNVRKGQ